MSKNYTVMELEAIKKLCKCVNSVASLPTDLIADTNVATNTTYSSYKIDAEMSALETDIQAYVDTALAGLNKLTKEVIDDKALVVKENVLYLYKDPSDMNNDYMQMMLINGVAVELGSTTCDFSSVYSKDEIDDKFALKIDLDVLTTSFNNLVASVEKKIDKDKIVTVLDDTVTDEQVASALLTKTELDKVNASLGELSDSLVDKQDFRVFKSLEEFNEKKGTSLTVVNGIDNMKDIVNAMIEGDMLIITTKCTTGSEIYFGLDSSTGWTKMFTFIKANGLCDVECRTTVPSTFKRVLNVDGVIGDWQELATMDKVNASLGELTTTDDITDTIDINSSGTKIPNVKAVYNDIIIGKVIDQTVIDMYGTEILKYPLGIWRIDRGVIADKFSDLPAKTMCGRIEITSINSDINENPWNNNWGYRAYNFESHNGMNYFRKLNSEYAHGIAYDTGWQRPYTTTVADVGVTTITPVNSAITGTIEYTVKNGICYVSMKDLMSTISSTKLLISTTMPKPSINCTASSVDASGNIATIYIDKNTTNLYGNFYTKNASVCLDKCHDLWYNNRVVVTTLTALQKVSATFGRSFLWKS